MRMGNSFTLRVQHEQGGWSLLKGDGRLQTPPNGPKLGPLPALVRLGSQLANRRAGGGWDRVLAKAWCPVAHGGSSRYNGSTRMPHSCPKVPT